MPISPGSARLPIFPLRLKLALWYTLVFLAIQLTLLTAGALYRHDAIKESFDSRLHGWASSAVRGVLLTDPPWTDSKLRSLPLIQPEFMLLAVRNTSGELIASPNAVDPAVLPPPPHAGRGPGPIGAEFETLGSERTQRLLGRSWELRVITLPFRDANGEQYFLQGAVSGDITAQSAGFLIELYAIGVPVGLIAALAASWLLAGRAVAPMRKLSEAARLLSPSSIEGRIHVETVDAEVARLEQELNHALERLAEGYRAQERFISNVSHELKTPISVILAEAQLFGKRAAGDEEIMRFITAVEEEMRRLGRLVEAFLTLIRSEQGGQLAHRQHVALNEVVLDAVQHCNAPAAQHQVRIAATLVQVEGDDDEPFVDGDPDLLRTMLENLLRNAVQHSPPGELVTVTLEQDGDMAMITVRDRGPGIPPEHLERIFDRFAQVPGRISRARGTGLGLAIARSVTMLHGGEIEARNADPGAEFVVRLKVEGSGQ